MQSRVWLDVPYLKRKIAKADCNGGLCYDENSVVQ